MKKLFALILVSIMLLASCGTEETTEKAFLEEANTLIKESKYEEAYNLLYKNRNDEEAKRMLEDFKVLYTNEAWTTYDIYNRVIERTYNEKGDIVQQKDEFYLDGMLYKDNYNYEYTYDENGNILCQDTYIIGSDDLYKKIVNEYDENGHLVFKAEKYSQTIDDLYHRGEFDQYYEYEYDIYGNVSYIEHYYKDGEEKNTIYCERNTYDENGKKLTYEFINTESNTYKTYYTYDENGFLIKETEERKSYNEVTEYTVNEHGDAINIKTTVYNKDGDKEPNVIDDKQVDYEYDEKGRQTKITTVFSASIYSDAEGTYEEYAYNEKGDVIYEMIIDWLGQKKEIKTEYEYFDNGTKRKETIVDNRYTVSSAVYKYDEYGNEISLKSETGERISEYTYNDKGLVATRIQNTNDEGKQVTEYKYDEEGRITERTLYPIDKPDYKRIYTYTYDDKNCIKEEKNIWGDIEILEYRYVYDENGRCIEKITISESGETKNRYDYDEKGNEIKVSTVGEDGNAEVWIEKSYDEDGNLIKTVRKYSNEAGNKFPYTQNFYYNENGVKTGEFLQYIDTTTAARMIEYSGFIYLYLPQK
ncbi:MAG: RHS repeat protein [Clostridia bacterium]|nr:RHS repeat protein [Clostridia bacterium]